MNYQEKIETLRVSLRPQNAFHTPQSKEEADAWIENQTAGNALAGIYFMVGYNYACQMAQKIIDGTHPDMNPQPTPEDNIDA
jgi:hypothetical protein